MIASNKQIVHMYVNALLPLAGGLIKQTTMAADWSVTFAVRVWSTIVHSVFAVQEPGNLLPIIPCPARCAALR